MDIWLSAKPGRSEWLGQKLNVSKTTMTSWRSGRGMPTLERAFLIERFTEGQVPAVSWLNPERLKVLERGIKLSPVPDHEKLRRQLKAEVEGPIEEPDGDEVEEA